MHIQILQVTINYSYLCEILYDIEKSSFIIDYSDDFVKDYRVDFNPDSTLFEWIDAMKKKSNLTYSYIIIEHYKEHGEKMVKVSDIEHFMSSNKMKDLVDLEQANAYQVHLIT